MPRWNLAWLLGITGFALLGYTVSHSAPPRDRDKDYELVRLVVEVLDEVDHKYVRSLDDEARRKLIEDMINGGLERLDPHSGFINKREYKRFTLNSRGKFGGIGVQLDPDAQNGRHLVVFSPMVDTPAYDAGILAGDVIVKIDGKSTENMRVADAVDLIQGEPGQKITLSVLHKGAKDPVDIALTRAEIIVQSIQGDVRRADNPKEWDFLLDKENKIGYIRMTGFSETTAAELKAALEQLQKDGARGLVLDLRFNPGGLLRSAVDVCRLFIDEGRIVSTKGRNQIEEIYEARPGTAMLPSAPNFPVAVIVNRLSASASEIVAAALQDHHRAVIVGERSYGKGSVQNVIEMEQHQSALKLTTASYWRPNGRNIHRFPDAKETDEWGVKPDEGFAVPLTEEDRLAYFRYRRDRDRINGRASPAPAEQTADKKPFADKPLEKALEYLRGEVKKARATGPASPLPVG